LLLLVCKILVKSNNATRACAVANFRKSSSLENRALQPSLY
jgi:hypothetical protein